MTPTPDKDPYVLYGIASTTLEVLDDTLNLVHDLVDLGDRENEREVMVLEAKRDALVKAFDDWKAS